jgi:excisionase family DNA binding protein
MSDERPETDETPTMTVPELAARIGIDPSTARRYLRAGQLPGIHVGNRWLIDRERAERFMAGREDAAGRPLIHTPPTTETPALTLLPERPPDTTETALAWLRGALSVMELLIGTATRAPTESTENRIGA